MSESKLGLKKNLCYHFFEYFAVLTSENLNKPLICQLSSDFEEGMCHGSQTEGLRWPMEPPTLQKMLVGKSNTTRLA